MQKQALTKAELAATRKAAENGDIDAQSKLCEIYGPFAEQSNAQDYAQGAAWCRRAAEQGNAEAQFMLGVAYGLGKGVPQDYTQEAYWDRKAAEQGIAWAQFGLGELYYNGNGLPQDYAQAAVWLRMAADQGIPDAQFSLGTLYDSGKGVSQDYAQAVVWYRKAADQGNVDAQFSLGVMYFFGKGVPQDLAQAVVWFRKAAEQGDTTAEELLKELLPLLNKGITFAASSASADTANIQTSAPLSPQAIAKRASESTVWIASPDSDGKSIIFGSGFAVEPDLIVTNSHVFPAGGLGLAGRIGSDQSQRIKQVIQRDKQDDIVLLYVPGLNLPSLPIDSREPVVGDTVFAMGNPEGMIGTFSEGIVSALRDHFIQITAPISHGSSGGPVFNTYGEVIGISTASRISGQNLNLAVPASEIDTLLKRARSTDGDSEEYPQQ